MVFHATLIAEFATLTDIQKYAAALPEDVIDDNQNWINPHYDSFYYQHLPSLFDKIFASLGIKKPPFDVRSFHTLLRDMTVLRTTQKLQGRLAAHRNCQPHDQFFIWGDLYGAFHSLVRDLTWLAEQKIIDDSLTITKAQHYIIFNGNQINRSPYSLETLSVILLLMQRNPEKIFYIRGQQEDEDYWRNFTLKRELIIRAKTFSKDKVPLASLLSDFFNTLPIALYLSIADNQTDVIRISSLGRDAPIIDIRFLGNLFLNTPSNTTVYHDTSNHLATAGKVPDVHAIIKTGDWIEGVHTQTGLILLDQDRASTAWALFSSPVLIHQEKFDFHYDALGLLDLNNPLATSTITLYRQDVKKRNGFVNTGTFNIMSGAQQGTKAFDSPPTKELLIGSTMSLERGVPLMGKYTRLGMLARINQENTQGGVKGHLLRAIIYNDDYLSSLARSNIRTLVNDLGIWLMLLPVGNQTLTAYLDYVSDKKILVLFPVSGDPNLRQNLYNNIIYLTASYDDEGRALIEHMLQEYTVHKFAFFYQDDAYGRGALATAHTILKEHGISTWTDVPYTRGATDFTQQAKLINEIQPDAIGFFSTAQATKNLISNIGIENMVNKQFFGLSFLGTVSFRQFVQQYNIPVVFGSTVPNPNTSQLAIVQEYREAMQKNNRSYYDVFSLQAYMATALLMDILQKIDPPFTQEKIVKQLEAVKNYNFKGITLNFNPRSRSLMQEVWIETGQDIEWKNNKIKS